MSLKKKLFAKIAGGKFNLNGHIPFQQELQFLYDNLEQKIGPGTSKAVVIASATTGEGSTTIASCYALLLARGLNRPTYSNNGSKGADSTKVLLIDANFRHPSVHQIFNVENDIGFSEMLLGQAAPEQCIEYVDDGNLSLIKAGRTLDNPSQLLKADSVNNIMDLLKLHFTYIIIDSAPVLSYFDTLALTRFCHGLVLNIRAETTRREVVQKAKSKLIEANLNILGVVLNRRGYYIPDVIYDHL